MLLTVGDSPLGVHALAVALAPVLGCPADAVTAPGAAAEVHVRLSGKSSSESQREQLRQNYSVGAHGLPESGISRHRFSV
jgi:hypothetical protein